MRSNRVTNVTRAVPIAAGMKWGPGRTPAPFEGVWISAEEGQLVFRARRRA